MTPSFGPTVPHGTFAPNLVQRSLMRMGRMIAAGPYARRMARPLRSLMRRVSAAPIDVTILGQQRMRLHPQGNSCEKRMLIIPHLFDRYELRLLSRFLHPGCTFIDVGANVGVYSIFAALRGGPEARIIAVEPHPLALERLRCNILLNNLTNVAIEPVALGDRSGLVTLKTSTTNIGKTSMVFDRTTANDHVIEVQCETLADLCRRHQLTKIDAIKLDVEGAEDLILFPFFSTAAPELWPRFLLIENSGNQWQRDCRSMLIAKGYRHRKIPSRNLVFWRPAP
jgi:FkbM family methyltransferase